MRKIIGIGETILDIIFKNGRPTQAVPGGSTFNSMVSLGRLGLPVRFITEIGNDTVGNIILDFMRANGLSTENIDLFDDGYAQSPISLAFLNENNDARYAFYHNYPQKRLDFVWPIVEADDLVIFGSYFAVDPLLRDKIQEFISYAHEQKAIIYYDVNFRKSHAHEAMRIIVFDTPNFIFTDGGNGVDVFCRDGHRHLDTPPIKTVSTIGAGDNFNAGILFALWHNNITREEFPTLPIDRWEEVAKHGIAFASEVCQSFDNYISTSFAARYKETDH